MFGGDLVFPLWESIQVYEHKGFISAGKCFRAAFCRELIYLHKYKITLSLYSLLVFSTGQLGFAILAFPGL